MLLAEDEKLNRGHLAAIKSAKFLDLVLVCLLKGRTFFELFKTHTV